MTIKENSCSDLDPSLRSKSSLDHNDAVSLVQLFFFG